MRLQKNEFADIACQLKEALLAAQNAKDALLLYFVERALFRAEKMADSPSNSSVEELGWIGEDSVRYSYNLGVVKVAQIPAGKCFD